jgi:predicted RNase H-like HicB family nuclease
MLDGMSFSIITALFSYSMGMELIFEVRDAEEGGYFARALGHSIFTEAETWDELRANVLEAVSLHFEEEEVHARLAACPR